MRTPAKLAIIGAAAFWAPDIFLNCTALFAPNMTAFLVLSIGTIVMPISLWLAWRRISKQDLKLRDSGWMLAGVWVMGPLALFVCASFSPEGGLRSGPLLVGLHSVLLSTLAFPLATPMAAGYDGSLVALSIATIMMLLVMARQWVVAKRSAASMT